MSDEPFEGADLISLVTDLSESIGGGDYFMKRYKDEIVNQNMWLCAVTVIVFGSLPSSVYIKYVS